MTEVKIYGALLIALLVGAYLSWTSEDTTDTAERVTLFDTSPEQIERIDYITKTQTVAFSFREQDGERIPWFELTKDKKNRSFVGNEETKNLLEQFAPFEGLRSLGKDLSPEELAATKLDHPDRKLIVKGKNRSKTFDVGGRTNGARDHYVRAEGSPEVVLVESRTLADLEFPDGKFMQRKLREKPLKDVAKVVFKARDKTRIALQKNRLSPSDAFWTSEEQPDEANETLKNLISKLEKLTATEYLTDTASFEKAEPVLAVQWYDEDGESLGAVTIAREGADKSAQYYARSEATHVPVKISRFTAEGLEKDLPTLFE